MLVDLLPKLLVGPDDNRVICILPVLAYDRKVYVCCKLIIPGIGNKNP